MDGQQKQALKAQIEQEIDRLRAQISLTKEATQPVELDQALAGRVSRIDAIQQQKVAEASQRAISLRLQKLKAKLAAIDDEGFGYCEECGEAISLARLQVKPEARLCIACQQIAESNP